MGIIIWDEVFETGAVSDRHKQEAECGSDRAKAIACACALGGWANCMAGNKPPEKFGFGMIALAKWSGLSVVDLHPENAGSVADKALAAMCA